MNYRDYYTYNSTHIEDCSNYCTRNLSSGGYTTWAPQRSLQTTGYTELEELPEVQANDEQEFQYFGWENDYSSKF